MRKSGLCAFVAFSAIGLAIPSAEAFAKKSSARIWVAKSDGALQCEKGTGESPETAEAGLKKAGVSTFGARKGVDSLMRITLCGSPAGSRNEVEIAAADRAKAEKLGFTPIEEVSEKK